MTTADFAYCGAAGFVGTGSAGLTCACGVSDAALVCSGTSAARLAGTLRPFEVYQKKPTIARNTRMPGAFITSEPIMHSAKTLKGERIAALTRVVTVFSPEKNTRVWPDLHLAISMLETSRETERRKQTRVFQSARVERFGKRISDWQAKTNVSEIAKRAAISH
jgi:hypothetical protein